MTDVECAPLEGKLKTGGAHLSSLISMIVPLNLSPQILKRLFLRGRLTNQSLYKEEVIFSGLQKPIVFISPRSVPRKHNKPKGTYPSAKDIAANYSRKDVLAIFESANFEVASSILSAVEQSGNHKLIFALGLKSLLDADKRFHALAIRLISLIYHNCKETERQRFIKSVESWLPLCSYQPLPILLRLVEELLKAEPRDFEWLFIERLIEFCVYIKSPELTDLLTSILRLAHKKRNIVLYISNSRDAHFTDYLYLMDRKFLLIQLDPSIVLYSSPQGYSMPLENMLLLFDSATVLWWRKPERLPDGVTSLEKFTKQEIREFVEQLRIKYSRKLYPQKNRGDKKFIYFASLAKHLKVVRVCASEFENSTLSWKKGDFVKPLSTQVVYAPNGDIEQSFSPFVYDGNGSCHISIMPPIIRQPNLRKEYEVRGNFFLDDVSCVKINTPKLTGEKAGIDWRYSKGVSKNMHPYTLSEEVEKDLISCFEKMDIRFCTFDLIFDGIEYYLLDVNHNGQWIFSDEVCDLKITRKIVDYLGKRTSQSK